MTTGIDYLGDIYDLHDLDRDLFHAWTTPTSEADEGDGNDHQLRADVEQVIYFSARVQKREGWKTDERKKRTKTNKKGQPKDYIAAGNKTVTVYRQ